MNAKRLVLLLGTAAALLPAAAQAQEAYSGTGFVISVPDTGALRETEAIRQEKAKAPLMGKAALTPNAQPAPAISLSPITSISGVSERLPDPILTDAPGDVGAPDRVPGQWFGTGIADITYGGVGKDTFNRGRVAGYIEGMTRGGLRVTGSADTREGPINSIFSDIGARDPDRVLNRLRDEQNYVTYGDDSTSREGAPTSGKIFLDLQKEGNRFVWGDFRVTRNAERLVRSDRTLYGARASHDSAQKTASGESRFSADLWAASPDRSSRQDILRATGGALYSLSRADVLPGTEKVILRTRDRFTGRIIEARTLTAGADYRFNAFQGILILNSPVADADPNGDLVREVVVAYEHIPGAGDPSGRVLGGRLEHRPSDAVTLGFSANHETSGDLENTIYGTDVTYEVDGLMLSAEIARSEGPRVGVTVSDIGGFGGDSEDDDLGDLDPNASGTAIRLRGEADLERFTGRPGALRFWHETMTDGFSAPDADIDSDQRDSGAEVSTTFGQTQVSAMIKDFESDDGRRKSDIALAATHPIAANQSLTFGIKKTDREDPDDADDNGARTVALLRWDREISEDTAVWVFGQATVSVSGSLPSDDRVGVGARTRLSENWTAQGEISGGNLGPAAAIGVTRTDESGEVNLGFKRESRDPTLDDRNENAGYLFATASNAVSENLTFRTEARDYVTGQDLGRTGGLGLSWNRGNWTVDGLVTRGDLRDTDDDEIVERSAISLGLAYADDAGHSGAVRAEYRRDASDEDDRDGNVMGLTGTYSYRLDERWRLLAGLEYLDAEGGDSFDSGRYVKADLGAAWRGTTSDRFSGLFLVSRVEDLPGEGVTREDGESDRQKATVVSADGNWKVNPEWTLGAKAAHRWLDSAPEGSDDFVSSQSTLGILRADYALNQTWDVSADFRIQKFHESGSSRTGATIGVWRDVGEHARIGVGYHAGGVHDDLRDLDDPESGAFINLIAKF